MTNRNALLRMVFATSLLSTSFTALAQSSTLQPISTHFAQTQTEISLDLTASSFSNVELDEAGFNLGYSVGGGVRTAVLDTGTGDYYNHTGKILLLGINMDKSIYDETQLLLNTGVRYYFDADDLHPRGLNSWVWADIKTAFSLSHGATLCAQRLS